MSDLKSGKGIDGWPHSKNVRGQLIQQWGDRSPETSYDSAVDEENISMIDRQSLILE